MAELEFIRNKIIDLEDELQHYTMVEKDKCKEFYIKEDLKYFKKIEQALLKAQEDAKKADALRELMLNHIDFVVEKGKYYFKIKNSKGKEKSFTSYTMLDFWKEVL